MKNSGTLLVLFFNLFLASKLIIASVDNDRKAYIVYMGELPQPELEPHTDNDLKLEDQHHSLLSEAIGDEMIAKGLKIYSYSRSFNGFAARLLPHEATILSEKENVVSVFPNTVRKLHTTRSWDFLGMPLKVKRNEKTESNLIIGLLDTGIWPDSPSFNDEGYGPVPSKWKGICVKGANFTGCNKKIIGARAFQLEGGENGSTGEPSPVDTEGHGTHTSSTAAGSPVIGASLYGLASGTARGGVPSARIAMYKVCWSDACTDMDILAAFDAAIADGVDIISISIGGSPRDYFEDSIAIGSFHAMKKGILTSSSAGNSGPDLFSIMNVAPWLMTVAASSIDRQFQTTVKLGNGLELNATGISINTFSPQKQMYPLTSGSLAANISAGGTPSTCEYGTLDESKVKGKIVYCAAIYGQDTIIKDLGGSGVIMTADDGRDVAFTYVLPAIAFKSTDGTRINQYINSTKSAKAVIYKSATFKIAAPSVASFSSRGPQSISPNILKPDIAAPGVDILAAYSGLATVTGDYDDNRIVKYNIISGTSMACPHATAAAAYVKSFHPDWSPAAVKSALITTATPMKIKRWDAELGSGSGQINPTKALQPGLVYDLSTSDYIGFLCKEGYNSTTIHLLTGGKKLYNCSASPPAVGTDGLNYPSFHLQLQYWNSTISAVFYRTVTNVAGRGRSTYRAMVIGLAKGLDVKVIPNTLSFDRQWQKRSFKVVVKGRFGEKKDQILSGLLEWSDSKHNVTSPILVYRPTF